MRALLGLRVDTAGRAAAGVPKKEVAPMVTNAMIGGRENRSGTAGGMGGGWGGVGGKGGEDRLDVV